MLWLISLAIAVIGSMFGLGGHFLTIADVGSPDPFLLVVVGLSLGLAAFALGVVSLALTIATK
jgi:hypothetical protein